MTFLEAAENVLKQEGHPMYFFEHPHIKGINGRDFAALILKYYDELPESARKIIPLRKVYIPMTLED